MRLSVRCRRMSSRAAPADEEARTGVVTILKLIASVVGVAAMCGMQRRLSAVVTLPASGLSCRFALFRKSAKAG